MTFPSFLFNRTFEENHTEIQAWWKRRIRWTTPRRTNLSKPQRRLLAFAAVIVAGAVLGSLLDPRFGFNLLTLALALGIGLALVTEVTVTAAATALYRRWRKNSLRWHLRALPSGLIVAAACVAISRLTGFLPGYLYGVVAGVAFAGSLGKRHEGQAIGLASAATLVVSVAAWLLWRSISSFASHPQNAFLWVVLQNFLAAVFVTGMFSLIIGLIPLRFLPGEKLVAWHRGAWATLFSVTTFLMLQIMVRPQAATGNAVPLITTAVLFVSFGAFSIAFWAFFPLTAEPPRERWLKDSVLREIKRPFGARCCSSWRQGAHALLAGRAAPKPERRPQPPLRAGSRRREPDSYRGKGNSSKG